MSKKRSSGEPLYGDLSKSPELLARSNNAQKRGDKPKDIMDVGHEAPEISAAPEKKTVMQTTQANHGYTTNTVNAHALQRGATGETIKDGPQVAQTLAGAQAQTKEKIAQFKADWKDAKRQVLTQFYESAQAMGIDPKAAAHQMIGRQAPGKAAALGFLAAEMAMGGGTMATMGKAMFVGREISKSRKRLSPKEQEALLEDMVRGLEHKSAHANQIFGGPRMEINWGHMGTGGIKALLAAHPEGEDQPELRALREQEHTLAEVEKQNLATAEHYLKFDLDTIHLTPKLRR